MPDDVLYPKVLVLPVLPTTTIDAMVADVGTLVYDVTKGKMSICITKAAGAGNWEDVTSA